MQRRTLLRAGVVGVGAAAFSGALWRDALGAPAQPGVGPYGPLRAADSHGIQLPAGFSSRVVARSTHTVSGTSYRWHRAPDGGACFADGEGWIYVSNSEVRARAGGGASAIRFSASGAITDAYRILGKTDINCAGGATPWGTWLSCEEVRRGKVYETDPRGVNAAIARPYMGRFKHEAVACDPDRRVIYLTEDEPDGCLYRFIPTTWGDLSAGELQVACGHGTSGPITWTHLPDRWGTFTQTRYQVDEVKRFNGGEGCWYQNGVCYFTTKGDNRVWAYDCDASTIALVYDDSLVDGTAPLTSPDNITGTPAGDLYVAEDRGNMEICLITPDDVISVFARIHGQSGSEITGPAFNPSGDRLYFSSQRGTTGHSSGGITYEVTGPFRR